MMYLDSCNSSSGFHKTCRQTIESIEFHLLLNYIYIYFRSSILRNLTTKLRFASDA